MAPRLSSAFAAGDTITVDAQTLTFVDASAYRRREPGQRHRQHNELAAQDRRSLRRFWFVGFERRDHAEYRYCFDLSVSSSNSSLCRARLHFDDHQGSRRRRHRRYGTVIGDDIATFTKESISGGAVTAYNAAGTPVNLQLRWAKTDSASLGNGHTDSWNLFYQTDPPPRHGAPAWVNTGQTFTFAADGSLTLAERLGHYYQQRLRQRPIARHRSPSTYPRAV